MSPKSRFCGERGFLKEGEKWPRVPLLENKTKLTCTSFLQEGLKIQGNKLRRGSIPMRAIISE